MSAADPVRSAGTGKHAVVYAHYPHNGTTPQDVWIALQRFTEFADRVLLVVAGYDAVAVPEYLADSVDIIYRPNEGWDFASYQAGIEALGTSQLRMLTICNDSVYGPLFPLAWLYDSMGKRPLDVWAITCSEELSWHLQSYFLCFGSRALNSVGFKSFWSEMSTFNNRREAIRAGELVLSQRLMEQGLSLGAFCESLSKEQQPQIPRLWQRVLASLSRRWHQPDFYRDAFAWLRGETSVAANPSLDMWLDLLEKENLPFVKRRALVSDQSFRSFMNLLKTRDDADNELLSAIQNGREYP